MRPDKYLPLLALLLLAACAGPDARYVKTWKFENVLIERTTVPPSDNPEAAGAEQIVAGLLTQEVGSTLVMKADGTYSKKGYLGEQAGAWRAEEQDLVFMPADGDTIRWQVRSVDETRLVALNVVTFAKGQLHLRYDLTAQPAGR